MEKEAKSNQSVFALPSFWQRAKEMAGDAGISYVVIRLLEMWLDGEIIITLPRMSPADRLNRESWADKVID